MRQALLLAILLGAPQVRFLSSSHAVCRGIWSAAATAAATHLQQQQQLLNLYCLSQTRQQQLSQESSLTRYPLKTGHT
jgi:hypothetical protein